MSLHQLWLNCNSSSEPIISLANYMCYTKKGGRRKLPEKKNVDFDFIQNCSEHIDFIFTICSIFADFDRGRGSELSFKTDLKKMFSVAGFNLLNCSCKNKIIYLAVKYKEEIVDAEIPLSSADSKNHTDWAIPLSDFLTELFELSSDTKKYGLAHRVGQIINIGLMAELYS